MDESDLRGDLAELPCFNLYLGWRRVQAFYKHFLGEGLNPQRVYVLELLLEHRELGVTQLARALDLDVATMSGLLSRMESEGLVDRPRAKGDRRAVAVKLTRRGRATAKRTEAAVAEADAELTGALDPSDVAALARLVERLGELRR
ncbi:MarR family winged helix-turn-helix transcriptional regulator [Engelhardtia mirabilis]|uniref:HTH-type transcriptional regulator MgrA n=1 Tax=Engelhardtia mirabilis TaxID=2528011 RepID=A0A518BR26_9BACT|nr:HTH-type transcriptional regulator MgrA [Planctomycetes bacterium Pla133]QDV03763.1 HTH-type transcriptional regulator MgrA [Planctomycetes bacterium Pla86]